jgi:hypothetical protein
MTLPVLTGGVFYCFIRLKGIIIIPIVIVKIYLTTIVGLYLIIVAVRISKGDFRNEDGYRSSETWNG